MLREIVANAQRSVLGEAGQRPLLNCCICPQCRVRQQYLYGWLAKEPDWYLSRLQHVAPGGADGEGGIDQTDVRVGLGEVSELGLCRRHKMLGNESDAVGAGEALIHDVLSFRQATQLGQCLNDPE